jgi:signal transduction histidine kinase/ActR/RegA family two-component response regulator
VRPDEFLRVAEFLPDALLLVSDGVVLAANRRAKTEFETPASELTGRPLEEVLTAEVGGLREFLRASARTRSPHLGAARHAADLSRQYRCEGSLLDHAEKDQPASVMLRLVPKERAIEAFMVLNQKIRELCVEIERRKSVEASLRTADRRKDEFLAMLAHELRNPLAPIRSGVELLKLERPDCETVETMQYQVNHLVHLVDDLLDVSRIMRGQIRLDRQPHRLNVLVKRGIDTAKSALEHYGSKLSICLTPDDPWIDGDEIRIAQVVTNLVHNAAKYAGSDKSIKITTGIDGDDAFVVVKDNGIGIDPVYLPEVFQLFSQADRSLDRTAGGLGVGLTVVEQIVRRHDGTVTAHSDGVGHGSEFRVRLPATAAPANACWEDRPQQQTRDFECWDCRVMVVDDSQAAAKMLQRILCTYWNHEVQIVHDGPAACCLARQWQPDVVLLDIGLPDMDGLQVAEALRASPKTAAATIVAVTGYGTPDDRQRSADAGFDMHLVKPIGVNDLRAVFQRVARTRPPT